MDACLKLGGDPTLGHKISIHNFRVPYDIIERLQKIFPKLKPLKIESPVTTLPQIRCCACNYYSLPIRPLIEEHLTLTHIHSSLELSDGKVFLFDRECAEKIKQFLEQSHPCYWQRV